MVTNNTLDLVLPANQGKHLPRSHLQGTKHDRAWLVFPIGSPLGYRDGLTACLPAASLAIRATPESYSKPKIKT